MADLWIIVDIFVKHLFDPANRVPKWKLILSSTIILFSAWITVFHRGAGEDVVCSGMPIVAQLCWTFGSLIKMIPGSTSRSSHGLALSFGAEFDGLNDLLDSTDSHTIGLNRNLVDARMSVQDLIITIQSGSIHSQEALVDQLTAFSKEAKLVSRGLQRFIIRVHGAADRILSANEHTLNLVEASRKSSSLALWLCTATGDKLAISSCHQLRHAKEAFRAGIQTFETSTRTLLHLAAELDAGFNRLDDRLDIIRDIVARAANLHMAEKDELLSDIWTRLGGHRKAVAELRTRAKTLNYAILYHRVAHRYVEGAHKELVAMDAQLEDLRLFSIEALTHFGISQMEVVADTIRRGTTLLYKHAVRIWCL
ncbi:hypothetical protein BV25DRAFT_1921467 [Artomyces pyxidatus]|uniref:Uncharacterized protein n=1 Tax=Artomyces pyxidatus TaxID=48021 RepID=A0ACB8SHI7_9AGAM|nr:hypothetical protein BV25DRAFT_1921467 [Artomyces pyxidatus]